MNVEYLVAPCAGRWSVSRWRHQIHDCGTREEAVRVADDLAKGAAKQENAFVKIQHEDGSFENLASYPREGFISLI